MSKLLDSVEYPEDLKKLNLTDLPKLATEIREFIVDVVSKNPGHLSSNLGVVELTIALHYCFDFKKDKIVWDVGHQAYVHKILTGRKSKFLTLRQYKGLSGFPDKNESDYDPFTCGHSGDAISAALGLSCADAIRGEKRSIVAVVGDGAIGAGMSLEALNHAGDLKKNVLVVLNDNEMSISNTVGAFSKYLNKIRTAPIYADVRKEVHGLLKVVPVLGKPVEKTLERIVELIQRGGIPGQIFKDLGLNYFGPIDGHDFRILIDTLNNIKHLGGPVLLHVITEKGRGFEPAYQNPAQYHSAGKFEMCNGKIKTSSHDSQKIAYTKVFGNTLVELAKTDPNVVGITAAMPDGTGIVSFGKKFPDRFYDVGICEQHAVGLANGLSAGGIKPVVAIYSTFLQRAYDQVFHDICLQKHGVVFALDRAGIVGNDGATHNGIFDIAYLRNLPEIVLMAPKDGNELMSMLKIALESGKPVAIRYPKEDIPEEKLSPQYKKFEIGKAEILREGPDGVLLAYGAMVYRCMDAAERLSEKGVEVTVVNARFAKPLDKELILRLVRNNRLILTAEDHALMGGFGSAVLELVSDEGENGNKIVRMGIPDRFMEHGPRNLILKNIGLDENGIAEKFIAMLDLMDMRGSFTKAGKQRLTV
ncbi:MAG: 1-deoxy-D-xylulose-5-phosphate synthase [Candidatus Brocadia sp.]|nr:1-deoxy-D-xylulose-5-phosphate synthase [Candidatus Brocadia fulgida]MCC6324408.1 1-deoxy-D-xylulose-5-phosphate synthase [Candidatus Brocadia sp.]MCE7910530.1 1-deoxy-D-xylulose-5-phosphate synthase [Candidatus Brocadia sp. AMX3]MDG5996502.1 1-deoxy-D-xylulose-5-phosphate synthase [Candidatus Brocadia sp.]RIK03100.1 MAG: 1-deoxy-D-xylulose-5-phosphate synthase [Candidatus Brocadia sp.]